MNDARPVWVPFATARLRQLGKTRSDLLKPLGVETLGAVGHYFSGRREITASQLAAMAGVLQCRPDELMGFSGNTSLSAGVAKEVPLISWVEAGMPRGIEDPYHVGDSDRMVFTTRKMGPNAYALKVTGQSMENPHGKPTYPEGSIILVDPDKPYTNGSPVIVRLENGHAATFKIYVEDSGRKFLKPLNPQYPNIELTDRSEFCGTVVQTIINED